MSLNSIQASGLVSNATAPSSIFSRNTSSVTTTSSANDDVLNLSNTPSSSRGTAVAYNSLGASLSLKATAKIGTKSTDASSSTENVGQLTFAFDASIRMDTLAFFHQKTAQTAQGLHGASRKSFVGVGKQISMRFQFSTTLSGSVLSGFSRGSEQLSGQSDLFDKWLGIAKDSLKGDDDLINFLYSLFEGFFSNNADFSSSIQGFFDGLSSSGLLGSNTANEEQTKGDTANATNATQLEFNFEFSMSVEMQAGVVQQSDPVMLDLDGDGFELSNYQQGASFDITGSGRTVQTAFVKGGDAFLALDRNGNGLIDSGNELFGDQHGAANGYEELAKLDDNKDGVISALDKAFSQLRLFRDNGNGKTEKGELFSLKEAGVTELSIRYRSVSTIVSGGNTMAQVASFKRADGSVGKAGDAILNYIA